MLFIRRSKKTLLTAGRKGIMRIDFGLVDNAEKNGDIVFSVGDIPSVPRAGDEVTLHTAGELGAWRITRLRWDFYPPMNAYGEGGHVIVYGFGDKIR